MNHVFESNLPSSQVSTTTLDDLPLAGGTAHDAGLSESGKPPSATKQSSIAADGYDKTKKYAPGWSSAIGTAFAAATFTASPAFIPLDIVWFVGPASGVLVGLIHYLRGKVLSHQQTNEKTMGKLSQLTQDYETARREIERLTQRQQNWRALMEQQVSDRTSQAEHMVATLEDSCSQKKVQLREKYRDSQAPLNALWESISSVRAHSSRGESADTDTLESLEAAAEMTEFQLSDLVRIAVAEHQSNQLTLETISTRDITNRLRQRLRALVYGRDIRVTVFATREAPQEIETDLQIFDRILDSLLTNAAKYTERGSIVVEADGSSSSITVQVSDSGCGIDENRLSRIFRPPNQSSNPRRAMLGIEVALEGLSEIGGRIEVMSKEGKGTTCWVHLPISPKNITDTNDSEQLVTIRSIT